MQEIRKSDCVRNRWQTAVCCLFAPRFKRSTHKNMEKLIIKRDGLPPIAFTGEQIASADNAIGHNGHANRWTTVRIYRSKGGKFIASLSRSTQWQGESDRHAAVAFESAAEIIDWLKEGESELGAVSQEAVEKAAKVAPEFAAAWVDEVE